MIENNNYNCSSRSQCVRIGVNGASGVDAQLHVEEECARGIGSESYFAVFSFLSRINNLMKSIRTFRYSNYSQMRNRRVAGHSKSGRIRGCSRC